MGVRGFYSRPGVYELRAYVRCTVGWCRRYLLEWPDGLKMFGNWMRGIAVYVGWSCLEVAYLGPRHMMGEGLVDGDRPLLT